MTASSCRRWDKQADPLLRWACWTRPLIRFSDGPAGRRARLVGTGKDIWEIIATVRDNHGNPAETARYLEIPLGLIQGAISYYGAYTAEIDRLIDLNDQETDEAHTAYVAGQAAVRP